MSAAYDYGSSLDAETTPRADAAMIREHLALIAGTATAGLVEVSYTEPQGGALNRARLYPVAELDHAAMYAAALNSTPGVNVYAGAALRRPGTDRYKRAGTADVLGTNALWFDADENVESVLAKCAEAGLSPPVTVQTGTRPRLRLHGWWPIDLFLTDPSALSAHLRGIASVLGTDPAATDAPRVLRLAGCVAWPKKVGRVPELVLLRRDLDQPPITPLPQLARAFPPTSGLRTRETRAATATGEGPTILGALAVQDLRSALTSMRADDRELWVRMGHALKSLGEEGRALWFEWSQTSDKYDPPEATRVWDSLRPEHTDFRAVFAEAQRGGWHNPKARAASVDGQVHDRATPPVGASLIRASDLLRKPAKPRPWLVRDVIPAGQVTELRGDGGAGKSTLALQLCAAAATGRTWLNMPVARGPAIYLASEDDEDELRRRLAAIAVHLAVSEADLSDLHLWPLATEDPALMVRRDGIEATPRLGELTRHMEEIRPALVVLDSRADVFAGEEINRNQVRSFVAALRKLALSTGAAVINLAHPSLNGISNRSGNSGSTHWGNAVRSALYLCRPTGADEAADAQGRELQVVKANYAASGFSMALRWSAGAFVAADNGSPTAPNTAEANAHVDRTFLKLLAQYEAQGRVVSDRKGANYAPSVFARDPGRQGVRMAGFRDAMNRLFAAGWLRVIDVGKPSRPAWKLVAVLSGGA